MDLLSYIEDVDSALLAELELSGPRVDEPSTAGEKTAPVDESDEEADSAQPNRTAARNDAAAIVGAFTVALLAELLQGLNAMEPRSTSAVLVDELMAAVGPWDVSQRVRNIAAEALPAVLPSVQPAPGDGSLDELASVTSTLAQPGKSGSALAPAEVAHNLAQLLRSVRADISGSARAVALPGVSSRVTMLLQDLLGGSDAEARSRAQLEATESTPAMPVIQHAAGSVYEAQEHGQAVQSIQRALRDNLSWRGVVVQLQQALDKQCRRLASIEAARRAAALLSDKTQIIVNRTSDRMASRLLARYFGTWRACIKAQRRQRPALEAMLARSTRRGLLGYTFRVWAQSARAAAAARRKQAVDAMSGALAEERTAHQHLAQVSSSLEAAKLQAVDAIQRLKNEGVALSREADRALALLNVWPALTLRSIAVGWFSLADDAMAGTMAAMRDTVSHLGRADLPDSLSHQLTTSTQFDQDGRGRAAAAQPARAALESVPQRVLYQAALAAMLGKASARVQQEEDSAAQLPREVLQALPPALRSLLGQPGQDATPLDGPGAGTPKPAARSGVGSTPVLSPSAAPGAEQTSQHGIAAGMAALQQLPCSEALAGPPQCTWGELVNPLLLLSEAELRAAAESARASEHGAAPDKPASLPPYEAAALRILCGLPLDVLLLRWANWHLVGTAVPVAASWADTLLMETMTSVVGAESVVTMLSSARSAELLSAGGLAKPAIAGSSQPTSSTPGLLSGDLPSMSLQTHPDVRDAVLALAREAQGEDVTWLRRLLHAIPQHSSRAHLLHADLQEAAAGLAATLQQHASAPEGAARRPSQPPPSPVLGGMQRQSGHGLESLHGADAVTARLQYTMASTPGLAELDRRAVMAAMYCTQGAEERHVLAAGLSGVLAASHDALLSASSLHVFESAVAARAQLGLERQAMSRASRARSGASRRSRASGHSRASGGSGRSEDGGASASGSDGEGSAGDGGATPSSVDHLKAQRKAIAAAVAQSLSVEQDLTASRADDDSAAVRLALNWGSDWSDGSAWALLLHRLSVSRALSQATLVSCAEDHVPALAVAAPGPARVHTAVPVPPRSKPPAHAAAWTARAPTQRANLPHSMSSFAFERAAAVGSAPPAPASAAAAAASSVPMPPVLPRSTLSSWSRAQSSAAHLLSDACTRGMSGMGQLGPELYGMKLQDAPPSAAVDPAMRTLATGQPLPQALPPLPVRLSATVDEPHALAEELQGRAAAFRSPPALLPAHAFGPGGNEHADAHMLAAAWMCCHVPELKLPLAWEHVTLGQLPHAVLNPADVPGVRITRDGKMTQRAATSAVHIRTASGVRVREFVPWGVLVPEVHTPGATAGGGSGGCAAVAQQATEPPAAANSTPHAPIQSPQVTHVQSMHKDLAASAGMVAGAEHSAALAADVRVPDLAPPNLASLEMLANWTHAASGSHFDEGAPQFDAASLERQARATVQQAMLVGDDVMLAHPNTLHRVAAAATQLATEWAGFSAAMRASSAAYNAAAQLLHAAAAAAKTASAVASREQLANSLNSYGAEAAQLLQAIERGDTSALYVFASRAKAGAGAMPSSPVPRDVELQPQAASALRSVRFAPAAWHLFAAVASEIGAVLQRAVVVRRARWGLWQHLKAHIQTACWGMLQLKSRGLRPMLLDRRETFAAYSFTQAPLSALSGLVVPGLHADLPLLERLARLYAAGPVAASPKSGEPAELDQRLITARVTAAVLMEEALADATVVAIASTRSAFSRTLQSWRPLLQRVFAYYAAADVSSSATTLDWREWLAFARDCKLLSTTTLAEAAEEHGGVMGTERALAPRASVALATAMRGGGAGMGARAVLTSCGGKSVLLRASDAQSSVLTHLSSGLTAWELKVLFCAAVADPASRAKALASLVRRGASDALFEPSAELTPGEFVVGLAMVAVLYCERERALARAREATLLQTATMDRLSAVAKACGLPDGMSTAGKATAPAGQVALSPGLKAALAKLTAEDMLAMRKVRPDVYNAVLASGGLACVGTSSGADLEEPSLSVDTSDAASAAASDSGVNTPSGRKLGTRGSLAAKRFQSVRARAAATAASLAKAEAARAALLSALPPGYMGRLRAAAPLPPAVHVDPFSERAIYTEQAKSRKRTATGGAGMAKIAAAEQKSAVAAAARAQKELRTAPALLQAAGVRMIGDGPSAHKPGDASARAASTPEQRPWAHLLCSEAGTMRAAATLETALSRELPESCLSDSDELESIPEAKAPDRAVRFKSSPLLPRKVLPDPEDGLGAALLFGELHVAAEAGPGTPGSTSSGVVPLANIASLRKTAKSLHRRVHQAGHAKRRESVLELSASTQAAVEKALLTLEHWISAIRTAASAGTECLRYTAHPTAAFDWVMTWLVSRHACQDMDASNPGEAGAGAAAAWFAKVQRMPGVKPALDRWRPALLGVYRFYVAQREQAAMKALAEQKEKAARGYRAAGTGGQGASADAKLDVVTVSGAAAATVGDFIALLRTSGLMETAKQRTVGGGKPGGRSPRRRRAAAGGSSPSPRSASPRAQAAPASKPAHASSAALTGDTINLLDAKDVLTVLLGVLQGRTTVEGAQDEALAPSSSSALDAQLLCLDKSLARLLLPKELLRVHTKLLSLAASKASSQRISKAKSSTAGGAEGAEGPAAAPQQAAQPPAPPAQQQWLSAESPLSFDAWTAAIVATAALAQPSVYLELGTKVDNIVRHRILASFVDTE